MTALEDDALDTLVRRHAGALKTRLERGATPAGSIARRGEERKDRRRRVVTGMAAGVVVVVLVGVLARAELLGVTGSANDRAAQTNLTNALTELSALYQSEHPKFDGVTLGVLNASAPEFAWTNGPVGAEPADAIGIYDHGQVAVLTSRSNDNGTCWYLLEVEQTGAGARFGETQPGVYYERSRPGQRTCLASAAPPGPWAGTYSSVTGPS